MKEKIELIVKACEEKIGKDIVTIKLGPGNTIADYFIIVTGNNANQTQAIADEIENKMEENGYILQGKEGYNEGNWILMDYQDVIVHIFLPADRDYYGLERLWSKSNK